MKRKFFFFSEMGYNAYPIEALEQYGYSALLFPNSIFDREKARDLWQMFLREHEYASEVGFDGSVCNEHHKGPGRGRGELGGACPRSRWWRAALNVQLLVYPRQRSP